MALSLEPNNSEFIYNYALTLQDMSLVEDAISCYQRLLLLEPEHCIALNNIGNAYFSLGEYRLAVRYLEQALEIDPLLHIAYFNLGNALRLLRLIPEAILSYRKALDINCSEPDYHWNLANALLLNGDYREGLEKYEYRWQVLKDSPTLCSDLFPCSELLWDGTNHCDGDEILLICEQGLGDAIQFLRYGKYLKNLGLKVGIIAPEKLHDLIRISELSDNIYRSDDVVKNFKWVSIMSLPRVLGVTPTNPLTSEPYLNTTSEKSSYWKEKIYSENSFIIALNWSGNAQPSNHGLDNRALPLEAFQPLSLSQSVSFLSLQKGLGSEQLLTCSFRDHFLSCQQEIDDTWCFLDAAAILMNCNLLITSDTSVAHLASALGRPTWLLLHANSEWRWGLEGDTTFWYPSIRLFRQRELGNWDEVMHRVSLELDKVVSEQKLPTFKEI
jgi:tetratricopeptide (TPR) repeat protein